MAVIGCDIPVSNVVGAEILGKPGTQGVWVKTLFREKDGFLCATTYLVAAGEPVVMEFRIDLKPLLVVARAVHERLHAEKNRRASAQGQPVVGFSFAKAFRGIKNVAKKIGKSKLIKSIGKAVKTVVKSKIVGTLAAGLAIAVPVIGVPALAAYGTARAAVGAINNGRKLATTVSSAKRTLAKAGTAVKAAVNVRATATARVTAAATAHAAAGKAQAARIAALAKVQAAKTTAANAAAIKARAAAQAKATLAASQAKAKAAAVKTAAAAKQVVAQATVQAKTATSLQVKLAQPAVRAQLTAIKAKAASAEKVLADIKDKAQFGTPAEKLEAAKNAAIVNLTAKNEARLQAMAQANAGGLPAMLIDKKGRIIRGRFRVQTTAPGKNPDVLYQGPGQQTQAGQFAQISGGSPFVPLSPSQQQARERQWKAWLATKAGQHAQASRHARPQPPPRRSGERPRVGYDVSYDDGASAEVGCSMRLRTGPMPRVSGTAASYPSIGCEQGSEF